MAYTRQTWADGPEGLTPIDAASLNYVEIGIEAVSNTADTAHAGAQAAQTTADGAVTDAATA